MNEQRVMFTQLSAYRLGYSVGLLFSFLYAASMIIVMSGPRQVTISFFNSIFHGIDVTSIMRWEMPWWEMIIGILEVFIIGCLCGAALAIFYNQVGEKAMN